MTKDDDFSVSCSAERARPLVQQALAAAQRAGGHISRPGMPGRGGRISRGRVKAIRASRLINRRSRFCSVKARVVRQSGQGASLARHTDHPATGSARLRWANPIPRCETAAGPGIERNRCRSDCSLLGNMPSLLCSSWRQ